MKKEKLEQRRWKRAVFIQSQSIKLISCAGPLAAEAGLMWAAGGGVAPRLASYVAAGLAANLLRTGGAAGGSGLALVAMETSGGEPAAGFGQTHYKLWQGGISTRVRQSRPPPEPRGGGGGAGGEGKCLCFHHLYKVQIHKSQKVKWLRTEAVKGSRTYMEQRI